MGRFIKLPILLMFLLLLVSTISTCPIEIDLDRPHILLVHRLFRHSAIVLALNDGLCFIGYLTDAGISYSQGHAWSKANIPTSILRSKVLTVGVDWIDTFIIASYGPNSTS